MRPSLPSIAARGPAFLDVSRRDFFGQGIGIATAALTALLGRDLPAMTAAATHPLAAKPPPQPARAKAVIHLHMIGGPSQLDLFDPKPALVARDGEACPQTFLEGLELAFIGETKVLQGSPFAFARHGRAGIAMSELLPHLAGVADDLCLVRGVHTDEINHAPAQMFLHTGFGRGGRPTLGAWTTYGLGSENDDLPAYVVLLSGPTGGAGAQLWSNGFLPGIHQGVPFRSGRDPVLSLGNPAGYDRVDRRRLLDAIGALNAMRFADIHDPEIATRIGQYEMAYRMQASVPELTDLATESAETLALYGVTPGKPSFAANCLLARRLVERGVRFVQLFDADWDHHGGLATRLPAKCRDVDRGMAALVTDLRRRGLLDETLVAWGGEFGRTPLAQGIDGQGGRTAPGRDHHAAATSMWFAGGGVRAGHVFGATDDFGFAVVEDPVHVHDLNATILHLLGFDHQRLTFRHQGRDYRLTDVAGNVVQEIVT
jgi:hypothetical protein